MEKIKLTEYEEEIKKMGIAEGIQQEFRRILDLMIELENRDKFETFTKKWIDLKKQFQIKEFTQQIQSQRTGLVFNPKLFSNSSPDTRKGNAFCKCAHRKYGHNLKENGEYDACHIDDCKCKKFQEDKKQ